MKVLYVDDEPELLKQVKLFLEKEDDRFNVDTAKSAEEGLSLLKEENYDAIISNYQMPEMNGLEFLEIIREDKNNDIPFIMFTGKGREEVAMEALNLGADGYLWKGGEPKSQYSVLANSVIQEVERHRAEERKKSSRESLPEDSELLERMKPIITKMPEDPDRFLDTYTFRQELEKFETRLDNFEKRLDDFRTERSLSWKKISVLIAGIIGGLTLVIKILDSLGLL